ncbi:MFS general substrate transporter [Serendipita vermifera]|nr:MFS general substrate transporter [Serendipita vermifera]
MSAQYPLAAVVGSLLDTYGTWLTAAIGGVLFSSGFGAFAYSIAHSKTAAGPPFKTLVACYFMCGVGTAASLFTIMFSASQAFPGHTGMSTGASTAFFGLSPLFLSFIASAFFTTPDDGKLNITAFLITLAIAAGIAHLIESVFLKAFPPKAADTHSEDEEIDNPVPVLHSPTERTPLINPPKPNIQTLIHPEQTIFQLLKDIDFWLLALTMLLLLGSCEMVISNIGTMILGVPETRDDIKIGASSSASTGGAVQVRLLSLSNTIARLLTGPLADYLAPAPLAHPHGEVYFPRKRYFSRLVFLSASCALMIGAYLWMAAGVISQRDIYLVSIATGVAYGASFTVTPSIVASLWMGPSAGRNFGIVTYAPFIGTPLFSYLYAFVSASQPLEGETVCTGTRCWRKTFWITSVTTTLGLLSSLILLRRRYAHV